MKRLRKLLHQQYSQMQSNNNNSNVNKCCHWFTTTILSKELLNMNDDEIVIIKKFLKLQRKGKKRKRYEKRLKANDYLNHFQELLKIQVWKNC